MARSLVKRFRKRRKRNSIIEMLSKIEKALPPSSVLMHPAPLVRFILFAKIFFKSLAIIMMKKSTI